MTKKIYEIKVTYTHWVEVVASDEDEAYEIAEDLVPTSSSGFEDMEMEIVSEEEAQ